MALIFKLRPKISLKFQYKLWICFILCKKFQYKLWICFILCKIFSQIIQILLHCFLNHDILIIFFVFNNQHRNIRVQFSGPVFFGFFAIDPALVYSDLKLILVSTENRKREKMRSSFVTANGDAKRRWKKKMTRVKYHLHRLLPD